MVCQTSHFLHFQLYTTMDEHGFEARLRHLEHVLLGQNNTQLKGSNETLIKRVEALQKELDAVYKNNKPIRDFVTKCKYGHMYILNALLTEL